MNDFFTDSMSKTMVRIAVIGVLAILSLFLFVLTVDAVGKLGESTAPATNTVVVEGDGTATAIPDTATVSFGASATAPAVADAQKNVTDKLSAAIAALKKQGVAEKDIRTTSYNVSPHYEYHPCLPGSACPNGGQALTGYDVSEMITVKIHDTTKVSAILASLGTAGVTDLSGPSLSVDEPSSVQAQARAEAITKARAKAQVLATQLGVRLGKVVSFSENGNTPQPMYAAGVANQKSMDLAAPATPPVPVGQNEYSSHVTITYEIR